MSDSKDYAVYSKWAVVYIEWTVINSSVTGKFSNHDLCEMRKVCSKLTIRQK